MPAFAAADWGTSRLRVWLMDFDGAVLAGRRTGEGMATAGPSRFGPILERHLDAMGAAKSLPVVICGMAGARQGWLEAPYVAVPAALDEIFASAMRVPHALRDVRIVPGLAQRTAGEPDVMRGEETQLAGLAANLTAAETLVCLPGTHSKWAVMRDGRVERFSTWMTGELFSVFGVHSILRHAVGQQERVRSSNPHFAEWVRGALDRPADLTRLAFRIRAATLLEGLAPADASAALSGMLIGTEIASLRSWYGKAAQKVLLAASGPLRDLYAEALGIAGLEAELADAEEAVRKGLLAAGRQLFASAGTRVSA